MGAQHWTTDEETRELATFLINLPPQDMQRRLSDALGVYVDAMRYPPGTENQRAAMWLEHTPGGGGGRPWQPSKSRRRANPRRRLTSWATLRCWVWPTATAARPISGGSS